MVFKFLLGFASSSIQLFGEGFATIGLDMSFLFGLSFEERIEFAWRLIGLEELHEGHSIDGDLKERGAGEGPVDC